MKKLKDKTTVIGNSLTVVKSKSTGSAARRKGH